MSHDVLLALMPSQALHRISLLMNKVCRETLWGKFDQRENMLKFQPIEFQQDDQPEVKFKINYYFVLD